MLIRKEFVEKINNKMGRIEDKESVDDWKGKKKKRNQ